MWPAAAKKNHYTTIERSFRGINHGGDSVMLGQPELEISLPRGLCYTNFVEGPYSLPRGVEPQLPPWAGNPTPPPPRELNLTVVLSMLRAFLMVGDTGRG